MTNFPKPVIPSSPIDVEQGAKLPNREYKKVLNDNILYNESKWPEIFQLTESEVLEIYNEATAYDVKHLPGLSSSQAYIDWSRMYKGIHREAQQEIVRRSWLACIRWAKRTGFLKAGWEARQGEAVEFLGLKELIDIRNKLYNNLPTGEINSFELLQIIKWHINDIDNFCSRYEKLIK